MPDAMITATTTPTATSATDVAPGPDKASGTASRIGTSTRAGTSPRSTFSRGVNPVVAARPAGSFGGQRLLQCASPPVGFRHREQVATGTENRLVERARREGGELVELRHPALPVVPATHEPQPPVRGA